MKTAHARRALRPLSLLIALCLVALPVGTAWAHPTSSTSSTARPTVLRAAPVPQLRGMDVEDARRLLARRGIPSRAVFPHHTRPGYRYRVTSQSPAAGAYLRPAERVVYRVAPFASDRGRHDRSRHDRDHRDRGHRPAAIAVELPRRMEIVVERALRGFRDRRDLRDRAIAVYARVASSPRRVWLEVEVRQAGRRGGRVLERATQELYRAQRGRRIARVADASAHWTPLHEMHFRGDRGHHGDLGTFRVLADDHGHRGHGRFGGGRHGAFGALRVIARFDRSLRVFLY